MDYLRENLKKIRSRWGLKQDEMAELMGVSRPMVSQYETAASNPSMQYLVNLQMMTKINLEDFYKRPLDPEEIPRDPDKTNKLIPEPVKGEEIDLNYYPDLVKTVEDLLVRMKKLESEKK